MSKIAYVELQGIHYYWDGQHIFVNNGVGIPWSISGSRLEQIELAQTELESTTEPSLALFSIDFFTQQWSLLNASSTTDIRLLDEQGQECAWPLLIQDGQWSRFNTDQDSATAPLLVQALIPSLLFNAQTLDATALELATGLAQPFPPSPLARSPSLTRAIALNVEDILQDSDGLFMALNASTIDTHSLNSATVDDVLNWLAVYSHDD